MEEEGQFCLRKKVLKENQKVRSGLILNFIWMFQFIFILSLFIYLLLVLLFYKSKKFNQMESYIFSDHLNILGLILLLKSFLLYTHKNDKKKKKNVFLVKNN